MLELKITLKGSEGLVWERSEPYFVTHYIFELNGKKYTVKCTKKFLSPNYSFGDDAIQFNSDLMNLINRQQEEYNTVHEFINKAVGDICELILCAKSDAYKERVVLIKEEASV